MTITVKFLEEGKQSPEEVAGFLADFLAQARLSLHLAVYDCRLSGEPARRLTEALRERADKGLDVRIVYDGGKPADPTQAGADPAPPGTADFIKSIGGKVQSKAITGGHLHKPRLMHHKYILRDGGTASGTVWTGSPNFTEDSWALQENNIVCIDSADLCVLYEKDFAELWSRGDIDTTGSHDRGVVRVGGTSVGVIFAPGDGQAIDHAIAHRISAARRRIKLCSMLVTSGGILGALGDALHREQVPVYGGLYDRTQMEGVFDQWRGTPVEWKIGAFRQISAGLSGKRSTPYTPGGRHDFMHNKCLVADDTVITGSYNLSHSATENAENVLMIEDAGLADQYDAYIEQLARRYEEQSPGGPGLTNQERS